MDYEKKYKDALGMAEEIIRYYKEHNRGDEAAIEDLEGIFPELKESEDEKIRRNIIAALKGEGYYDCDLTNECIAWLEKQGEQKPTNDSDEEIVNAVKDTSILDMVEPKFKVGDWIITKDKNVHKDYSVCKIVEIENNRYHLENGDYLVIDTLERYDYRLWTIQDAKDGDVLYSLDSKQPFIFKHRKPNEQAAVYCGINTYGKFFIGNTKDCVITTDKYIPATKEQRDLLFKKMKEAGYQWNPDTKELKKIEQKPTWSEGDSSKVQRICQYLNEAKKYYADITEIRECMDWLKSLKGRLS